MWDSKIISYWKWKRTCLVLDENNYFLEFNFHTGMFCDLIYLLECDISFPSLNSLYITDFVLNEMFVYKVIGHVTVHTFRNFV